MAQILVVDDEVGIRELLSEILSDEGHGVSLAESAAAARRLREANRPDLVLLDIKMSGMNGIETLAELKKADDSLPATGATPQAHAPSLSTPVQRPPPRPPPRTARSPLRR